MLYNWLPSETDLAKTCFAKRVNNVPGAQAVEALRALNNPKTSLVKKRQLMRVNFGDYRKKMAQEEKQYYASKYSFSSISFTVGYMQTAK